MMNAAIAIRPPVNRRELLSYFFLVAAASLIVSMLSITYSYALPRPIIVGLAPDYPLSDQPYLIKDDVPFWLVNTGGRYIALKPETTHRTNYRYAWSTVTNRFEDPLTGSKFTLIGQWIEGPATRNLDQYRVTIQRGEIQVWQSTIIRGDERDWVCGIHLNPQDYRCRLETR